jgi:hypothetical protein
MGDTPDPRLGVILYPLWGLKGFHPFNIIPSIGFERVKRTQTKLNRGLGKCNR